MRIFRACRCRHLPLPLPLPLVGRAYCGPQAATSLSSFSLMTCIAFFGCYCCCCYRNLLIIAINVIVFYCLLIPGDKVKSINLSRQPCMRFCFWFLFIFDLLTNRAGITVRVLCLFSCCRRRRRCRCCSCLSFYVLRCGSGCLLLITCIFTLRFSINVCVCMNVCVCFITKIKIGACVCIH